MKLKVLVDNNTLINEYYLAEPAVSYYIEDGDTKILFDTGYSDCFLKNADKMKINLNDIDKIILSHGHNDHTGGLKYLVEKVDCRNVELIAHKDCFKKKVDANEEIGATIFEEELSKKCQLNLSNRAIKISENIFFLGEIPQINDFEKRERIGNCEENGKMIPDLINEDTAIVYKSSKGLFVITGCSHSGVCNIIEYAKRVCKEDRIYGVIGGFHLFENNSRLKNTVQYLKKQKIELLYPCHCVSLKAKIEMAKEMEIHEVGVGLEIDIEN